MTKHLTPSQVTLEIARVRDFGEHRAAYAVNRAHDRSWNTALLMLVAAPVPILWFAYRSSPLSGSGAMGQSVPGMIVLGLAGLLFLVFALWLGIPGLLVSFSHPHATVHLFARGAVAIRHRGGSYSWPYENATVRYVVWQEEWEGTARDRPQLWVTFRDGETICFDGHEAADRAWLPDLSVGLGGHRDPEGIGELRSADAPTPF